MPRDSNGNYSLPPGTIVSVGDKILPAQHNPAMTDIGQSLTNSLPRNGTGQMLADLNMGGFNLINTAGASYTYVPDVPTITMIRPGQITWTMGGGQGGEAWSLKNDSQTNAAMVVGRNNLLTLANGLTAAGGAIVGSVTPRPFVIRVPAAASGGISWQLGGNAFYDVVGDASGNLFFNRSNILNGSYIDTPLTLATDGSVAITKPTTFSTSVTFNGQIVTAVASRPVVVRIPAGGSAGISWQLGLNAGYDAVVDASGNFFLNRSNIANGTYLSTPLYLSNAGNVAFTGASLTRDGFTVWDAGNDGAASGLDAGLLGGEFPNYYTNIPARLGYTPVNQAGDTMTGDLQTNVSQRPLIVRIGAGSAAGISWQLGGRAGYDLVVDASGNFFFNRSNIATGAYVDTPLAISNAGAAAFVGPSITRNGLTVFDAGNDGPGSGLDADTVDGRQASEFALLASWQSSDGSTGWRIEPDGTIMQWGVVTTTGTSGIVNVTFPRAFASLIRTASAINLSGGLPGAVASVGNLTTTGMTVGQALLGGGPAGAGVTAAWQAWGK